MTAERVDESPCYHMVFDSTSLPRQPMQIRWWCANTQIRSDHLQIIVRTLAPSDLIREIRCTCCVDTAKETQSQKTHTELQQNHHLTAVCLHPQPPFPCFLNKPYLQSTVVHTTVALLKFCANKSDLMSEHHITNLLSLSRGIITIRSRSKITEERLLVNS